MLPIPMIDLRTQYLSLKSEMDVAIQDCLLETQFIGGKNVHTFEQNLAKHINIKHCISCGNGTDALQIALMSLNRCV